MSRCLFYGLITQPAPPFTPEELLIRSFENLDFEMIPRSELRNDSWPTLAAEITTEADFGQHNIGIATRGAFLVSRGIEMDRDGDQHIQSGVHPPV